MTKHYDTLGVPPNATPDEIRQAYRRAASKAHPDREGGSTEQMQAVNRAFEVLSDPAKRQRYDETGIDDGSKTIEELAIELLFAVFEGALDADLEPVQHAREKLGQTLRQMQEALRDTQAKRERLVKRTGKTKVKNGARNIVQHLIDRRLAALKVRGDQIAEAIAANKKAAEILADYEGEPPPPDDRMQSPYTASAMAQMLFGQWQR